MPFGGTKNSGVGREECMDELLSYTRQKSVHVTLR
jgi:betaine-aldehyde dehydrogenase